MDTNILQEIKIERDRRTKWDIRFLEMAQFFALRWSKDPSTKCGAVITRNLNQVVQSGYNGYPVGVADDDTLNTREQKYARIIHAEMNAIVLARQDLSGCTIYVWPLPPCERCAGPIIQSGIKRVVSVRPSDPERAERWNSSNELALDMFAQAGVIVDIYDDALVDYRS